MNFNAQLRDVYLIKAEMADGSFQYKIGISKHPEKRLKENNKKNYEKYVSFNYIILLFQ
jgi:predicted GIY-YIG superfamily endonuclease